MAQLRGCSCNKVKTTVDIHSQCFIGSPLSLCFERNIRPPLMTTWLLQRWLAPLFALNMGFFFQSLPLNSAGDVWLSTPITSCVYT